MGGILGVTCNTKPFIVHKDIKAIVRDLHRCTKCILPATMPFIEFDKDGVCNYCHTYEPMQVEGIEKLLKIVEPYRRSDGHPDCMVMFSGGRDNCHGLHVVKKELGLNPIAFSYDWGVLTDLGRRNQAHLCEQLGVEHVVVSANIPRKREYVRKNLMAWLKKPELGMVPILMAGDKQVLLPCKPFKTPIGPETSVQMRVPFGNIEIQGRLLWRRRKHLADLRHPFARQIQDADLLLTAVSG